LFLTLRTLFMLTSLELMSVIVCTNFNPKGVDIGAPDFIKPSHKIDFIRPWRPRHEELDGPAVSALRRAIVEVKQCWSVIGWMTKHYLELLRASDGTLSRWSRLHLQSLAPTNPHWASVVGYDPFSLCVIHKEGLSPSSGDSNRLIMTAGWSSGPVYETRGPGFKSR
jgi:hypothetical protein